jgi:hypothetical protein
MTLNPSGFARKDRASLPLSLDVLASLCPSWRARRDEENIQGLARVRAADPSPDKRERGANN